MENHPNHIQNLIDISNHNTWHLFEDYCPRQPGAALRFKRFSVYKWRKTTKQWPAVGFFYVPPEKCAICPPCHSLKSSPWCIIEPGILLSLQNQWEDWNAKGQMRFYLQCLNSQIQPDEQNNDTPFISLLWKTDAELTGNDYNTAADTIPTEEFKKWLSIKIIQYQITMKRNFSLGSSNDESYVKYKVKFCFNFAIFSNKKYRS